MLFLVILCFVSVSVQFSESVLWFSPCCMSVSVFFYFVCFVYSLSWIGVEKLFGECLDIVLQFFLFNLIFIFILSKNWDTTTSMSSKLELV